MVRSLSEESEAAKTSPTRFHHMLARLGEEKRLTRLYTQNIDGIETSLQPLRTEVPLNHKDPPVTIQLHGSLDKMVCQKCRTVGDLDRKLFESPEAPECKECASKNESRQAAGCRSHGIGRLRPRIVLYNEHNPDEDAITSIMNADVRSRPDALIVAGTSLKIPGVRHLVKNLCSMVRSRKNGVTMWINNEPPVGKEFEDCWDLIVGGNCDEVAGIVDSKPRGDSSKEQLHPCGVSEVEEARRRGPSVVVPPSKKKQQTLGLATPSSSNDEEPELPHKPVSVPKGSKPNGPKKPARKSSAPKKPNNKGRANNTKITDFNRVGKSGAPAATKGTGQAGKPMDTLPKGAARNNRSTPSLFPNLRRSK